MYIYTYEFSLPIIMNRVNDVVKLKKKYKYLENAIFSVKNVENVKFLQIFNVHLFTKLEENRWGRFLWKLEKSPNILTDFVQNLIPDMLSLLL